MTHTSWPYTFPVPLAALQDHGYGLRRGVNLDLVGVDGRLGSALRRFPGFNVLRSSLDSGAFSSGFSTGFAVSSEVEYSGFFKYAEIQKGDTGYSLRGFVASQADGGLRFYYYDTQTTFWHEKDLLAPGSITQIEDVDISYSGKFLYIALLGTVGKSCFWWNSQLHILDFGFAGEASIEDLISSNLGGLLTAADGTQVFWTVGIRFGDSRRNVWSPMVTQEYPPYDEVLVISGGATYHLRIQVEVPAAVVDTYDTIEVYRTITNGGILRREIFHHVPTETGNASGTLRHFVGETDLITGRTTVASPLGVTGGLVTVLLGMNPTYGMSISDLGASIYQNNPYLRGGLNDSQLSFQQDFDPDTDDPGDVPKGNRVFSVGGITLKTDADTSAPMSQIRWSRSDVFQPETFPSNNVHRTSRSSDTVVRFSGNSDYLFALTKSRAYRMNKVGAAVGWERVAHGFGPRAYGSAAELPASLAILAPAHLNLISPQGAVSTISLLDHQLSGNSTEYQLAYDAVGECLFIISPTDGGTSYCLWGATNVVTTLGGTRFITATSGPQPDVPLSTSRSGISDLAFFLTVDGRVLYADFQSTASNAATFGVTAASGTLAAPLAGATTFSGTFAGGTNSHTHTFLYVLRADGTITRHRITANTATDVTVSEPITASAGDRWVAGTVLFQWAGWPLWDTQEQNKELLNRRVALGLKFDVRSVRGSGTTRFTGTFFDRDFRQVTSTASPVPAVEATVNWTQPDKNWLLVRTGGPTLIPSLICVDSNRVFDLLGVTVKAALENTEKSTSE